MAVSFAAFSAAFRDARFPPLREDELHVTTIEISVLSPLSPYPVTSESELLEGLAPGIDGLLLEAGRHHATFLPKVWDQLPEPIDFLRALKQKAGLPPNYWSEDMRFHRYRTLSFSDETPLKSAIA